ncbi:MAG TPA: Asp-tRNA(Asn)/Glu-tRNA(Gln) amidotransferase subunit GatB [Cyclobacteriaceae bacterium]|jgi:aspartyl-tRNA(Asn)/glutamyl-tRNA(Gln) amidotransferase subunit B|nr:Asp-tRNA(Asn)/Glu-tRNA(Gln) amidotransferase subunit GatB [Cyclobacteriaceae bacterium]
MEKAIRGKYTVVIGLEVHAQLLLKSKIFNSDSAEYGGPPNTHVGVISLAHPGTLPKLNRLAVEHAVKMGLACHSEILRLQIFDRKNYFYPDLPKGYQITQNRTPICVGGFISVKTKDGIKHDVKLNRIHLEEDAGKSIHLENETDTLVDFNRAGVALIEIVTEPVIKSSEEAATLLSEIRKIVRYLDICDGNMEEGSLRCDANVSVMLNGAKELGKKVEVKNMNSFRHVHRAIDFEVERQIELIERGELVISETRTFNVADGKTYGMRTKEELNDYRYFPDPDLSPLVIAEEWLKKIKSEMPALPNELFQKFMVEYGLPEYDAQVLTETKEFAAYFEELCSFNQLKKENSNWLMGPVKSYLNENALSIEELTLPSKKLAELIGLVGEKHFSYTVAVQELFPRLVGAPNSNILHLAQELNLIQNSDNEFIEGLIDNVIREFPLKVEEYHNGKKGIVAMFMGEVMKRSSGKANPKAANELLVKKLTELVNR